MEVLQEDKEKGILDKKIMHQACLCLSVFKKQHLGGKSNAKLCDL